MNLKALKTRKEHSRLIEGILVQNPIFVRGLALPFAVMITTNLKSAVAVSILFACSLIPCVILSAALGHRFPKWVMMMFCSLMTLLLVMAALPLVMPISPEVVDSLGIYIPILSVNSVISFLCLRHRKQTPMHLACTDAVMYSIGFALALCMIAAIRELLGSNTLWGFAIAMPVKLSGFQVAFSGFIVTAFLCALFQAVGRCMRAYYYRCANPPKHKEGVKG